MKKGINKIDNDKVFKVLNYSIMIIVALSIVYPVYFMIIASISEPDLVNQGKVLFFPKQVHFEGYKRIFRDPEIWIGYKNSILYTLVGTVINITLTMFGAYSLSRKDLPGKNIITGFIVFTMLFNGGLIPTFLVVKKLQIYNTFWAMVLPNAVAVWYIIIARSFLKTTIPHELIEAAHIDGCSDTRIFYQIILPLSKAIIATLALFYGVGHWNSYFQALIYIRKSELYPLQIILRKILILSEMQNTMTLEGESIAEIQRVMGIIKYALVIVASIPMLAIYPFIQKYFVKGVMIGSLKG